MKKLDFFKICAAIAVSVLAVSCGNNEEDEPKVPQGEKVTARITLNIAPVSEGGQTVADTRSSLANVWILGFNSTGTNVLAHKESRFDIGKPVDVEIVAGSGMKYYAVANVDAGTIFSLGKLPLSEFMVAINSPLATTDETIPLVGGVDVSVDTKGQEISITAERIMAKLSYKFSYKSGTGYEVKSVTLKNVPKYPYYVSQGDNSDWGADAFRNMASQAPDDQVQTYFIPENLMGTVAGISSPKDKVVDKQALCIEIVAEKPIQDGKTVATYRFYPGGNTTTDFNVRRNNRYSYDETVDFSDESDSRIMRVNKGLSIELPESNCYMMVPGAMDELAIPVTRVNAFWTSGDGGANLNKVITDGTNGGKVAKWKARVITSTEVEELVSFVRDEGVSAQESIIVKSSGVDKEGSVLIGIFDATNGEPAADAKPLWSWHLWVTYYNPGNGTDESPISAVENNPGRTDVPDGTIMRYGNIDTDTPVSGGTQAIMDRNLGALSADPADGLRALGQYYQWGRKDPLFVDLSNTASGTLVVQGLKANKVSIIYTVENPLDFIYHDSDQWGYANTGWAVSASNHLTLWRNTERPGKTIYDPCPAGWRVPHQKDAFAGGDIVNSKAAYAADNSQLGLLLFHETVNTYIPLAGYINNSGKLYGIWDANVELWVGEATGNENNSYVTRFVNYDWVKSNAEYEEPYGKFGLNYGASKSTGHVVRCVKD